MGNFLRFASVTVHYVDEHIDYTYRAPGRMRTRAWEDRNQVKRYTTEIYVDTFELLARPVNSAPAQQPAAPNDGGKAPF